MAYHFMPLETFDRTVKGRVHSRYREGMVYTVRDGNEGLAALVAGWAAEGKVTLDTAQMTNAPNALTALGGAARGTVKKEG